MQNLSDINQIEKILSKNGFSFSKSLGQNFIIDDCVCPAMAEAATEGDDYGVIEVGPGIGVLTVELAKRAKKVISIELDKRLLPILDETLADYDNVEIINDDILEVDLKKVIEENFKGLKVVICANLPYYITSPVIMKLLQDKLPVESITVMVQKEAADRICAEIGTRDSGAVTIAVNYYAETEKLFDVPRESFTPSPKVDSTVMKLHVRKEPVSKLDNEDRFFSMVKAAFSQRRKTISNSLSACFSITKDELNSKLQELEIPSNLRIEQLTMQNLIDIYNKLK